MKKFNYRIAVNITDRVLHLGFHGQLPEEMCGQRIRLQAVFSQRQVDRRFPMEVTLLETDLGTEVNGEARIELPYVFYRAPRHKVKVTFALWSGMKEYVLQDQPFPVNKEMFIRAEREGRRNILKFALGTAALPMLLAWNYLREGKDMARAKKRANDTVYRFSGYSYSPRQRHTDYFAIKYARYASRTKTMPEGTVLFLSERLPEEGGNLQLVKEQLKADPRIEVSEFIRTTTVDGLKKSELRECARKCARARVIILEDFYPQLHRLSIRKDTKVVQLWHACGAFKTFGLTRMGKPGGAPQSSMNHRNYDLVTVSSEAIRGIYAEAFAVPTSKVQALGTARTDCLYDGQYKQAKRESIYEKYPQLCHKTVVLFAPTFRGDGNKDAYYPPEAFDVQRFMEAMPENVICIVKHHPFVRSEITVEHPYKDRVLDLTGQDHINDLMLVSDLLITDYSSGIFEAAILNLPMIFYAFDKEEYIASRDFYFDYEVTVPGPVETTFEGLTKRTRQMLGRAGHGRPASKYAAFRQDYLGALDGQSTDRICQYIKTRFLGLDEKHCLK